MLKIKAWWPSRLLTVIFEILEIQANGTKMAFFFLFSFLNKNYRDPDDQYRSLYHIF